MADSDSRPDEHRVVASRLREARQAIGLTQADTATALGIGRSSVVSLEQGTRKVTGLELRRLARLYQCSVGWLLGETPDESGEPDKALHRATAKLSEQDREQVLRFAQFLAAQPPERGAPARTSRPSPPPSGEV